MTLEDQPRTVRRAEGTVLGTTHCFLSDRQLKKKLFRQPLYISTEETKADLIHTQTFSRNQKGSTVKDKSLVVQRQSSSLIFKFLKAGHPNPTFPSG